MTKFFNPGDFGHKVIYVVYLMACALFPAYPMQRYLKEKNGSDFLGPAEWSILALSSIGTASIYGALFYYSGWPTISVILPFQLVVAVYTSVSACWITALYVFIVLSSTWLPWFSFRKIAVAERFTGGKTEYVFTRGLYWRRSPPGKYYTERQPWGGVPKRWRVAEISTAEGERISAALNAALKA